MEVVAVVVVAYQSVVVHGGHVAVVVAGTVVGFGELVDSLGIAYLFCLSNIVTPQRPLMIFQVIWPWLPLQRLH